MARTSIRDQIAAKRLEHRGPASPAPRNAYTKPANNDNDLEEITVSSQIQKAVKTGKLDFSSLKLAYIPHTTYTKLLGIPTSDLSNPPPPAPKPNPTSQALTPGRSFSANLAHASSPAQSRDHEKELVFGGKAREVKDDIWVEPEELVSFKGIDCGFQRVEIEFGSFGGLKVVNLRGNRISALPDTFADLLRLTSLDLSHNALTAIPKSILLLPALQQLDISHNALTAIDLSSPIQPTDDGLSYGAGFLSTSFSRLDTKPKKIWPLLSTINLGFNRISVEGVGFKELSGWAISSVNLESNAISGVLDLEQSGLAMKDSPQLAALNLSGNTNLSGTTGNLASSAHIDTSGCRIRNGPSNADESAAAQPQASTSAPPISKAPLPEGVDPSPQPTMSIVYRTCPAATFDSEPLAIGFDLYLPPTPGKHPLLIWWHGGGLLQGNKENLPPHFRRLPQHSFEGTHVAVISPNYRLAPQAPILDILSDSTALLTFVREKLNDTLKKHGDHSIDTSRICLSGGSAGGYLALLAGLPVSGSDEDVGGYRGEKGIKCIAPFYPITDLADRFWATETNPVPWWNGSVPHAAAKPHLDRKAPPVATAQSGGPRSILYPYMLQHGLFPGLLFQNQRSVGNGLDAFRPSPEALSVPQRVNNLKGGPIPPIYFIYGTEDKAVNPFEKTIEALQRCKGDVVVEVRQGEDHAFDEDEREECSAFRDWIGRTLI